MSAPSEILPPRISREPPLCWPALYGLPVARFRPVKGGIASDELPAAMAMEGLPVAARDEPEQKHRFKGADQQE